MTISSDAKSKADTSARLAGVTDNPRVRALFESLAEEFAALETDESLEAEFQALKARMNPVPSAPAME